MNEWQRLDSRMLLLGPVSALRQFLFPAVIALIGVGTRQPQWLLYAAPLIVLGSIALGALPWLTTRFRVADGQLVVTRGLINRTRLTAPLDRIRSVDLEASVLHRLLDLQKVQVGTGVDDTMIELNALTNSQAAHLRSVLLARRAPSPVAGPDGSESSVGHPAGPDSNFAPMPDRTGLPSSHYEPEHGSPYVSQPGSHGEPQYGPLPAWHREPESVPTELARFSPSWAKYAPLSVARLAIVAGALGALWQIGGDFNVDLERGRGLWTQIVEGSVILIVFALVVGALLAWILGTMAAALVQWWDMRLVRDEENIRLTRGLFTTASTTIEEKRIRGVQVRETALLRTAGAAELHALVTGLDDSVYALLPPAPFSVTTGVAESVLGDAEPLSVDLVGHGPWARRRCYTRNVLRLLPVVVIALAATFFLDGPVWAPLVVIALLTPVVLVFARAEYAHLGHALTTDHLIAGSGITARTRTVLQSAGVIGWVVSQTFFQRRRGLASLVATTAAGSEQVLIRDLPLERAIALAVRTTPDVLDPFLSTGPCATDEQHSVNSAHGT